MINRKVLRDSLKNQVTFRTHLPGSLLKSTIRMNQDYEHAVPTGVLCEFIRVNLRIEVASLLEEHSIRQYTVDFSKHALLKSAWESPSELFSDSGVRE
jgi:hypothetical protein